MCAYIQAASILYASFFLYVEKFGLFIHSFIVLAWQALRNNVYSAAFNTCINTLRRRCKQQNFVWQMDATKIQNALRAACYYSRSLLPGIRPATIIRITDTLLLQSRHPVVISNSNFSRCRWSHSNRLRARSKPPPSLHVLNDDVILKSHGNFNKKQLFCYFHFCVCGNNMWAHVGPSRTIITRPALGGCCPLCVGHTRLTSNQQIPTDRQQQTMMMQSFLFLIFL